MSVWIHMKTAIRRPQEVQGRTRMIALYPHQAKSGTAKDKPSALPPDSACHQLKPLRESDRPVHDTRYTKCSHITRNNIAFNSQSVSDYKI